MNPSDFPKLPEALIEAGRAAIDIGARHPRKLSGSVAGLLAVYAIAAFGIAPLAPDAASLPRSLVTEELSIQDSSAQTEALALQDIDLSRSGMTRPRETAAGALHRLGVTDPEAIAFVSALPEASRLFDGRSAKPLTVTTDEEGRLLRLVGRMPVSDAGRKSTHFDRLTIVRERGELSARVETAPFERNLKLASGTIRSSLFAATDEARIPDSIAGQLVDIFAADLDFHRQLRRGDTFSLVYETLTADGEPASWADSGRVQAAEFVNAGKVFQAVWYADAGAKGAYYTPDGKSKRQTFLASPMTFSRITSGFAMRLHPIQKQWKAHRGVDYGAPTGTAVRTVGDGTVDFAGRQNGYGNVIFIRHANDRTTVYAHLSRIDVHRGERVEQGQTIGAVGATGWATGPHLHFEFRIHGEFQDPLQVARSSERVELAETSRAAFTQVASVARSRIELAESLNGHRDLGE